MTTNPSHVPQYYQFIATEPFVEIFITVTGCHGLDLCGLQAVIIDQCAVGFNPWTSANIVACDAQACLNQQLILAPGGMVPGQTYWLMIDNDGEAFCEYHIEHLEGVLLPDITEEIQSVSGYDSIVCPGQDIWFAIAEPTLTTVSGYLWTGFPWDPGFHTSRYADMGGGEWVTIPDDAPTGTYEICVYGYTGCDTTDVPVCFDLEIRDLGGISEPITLCREDFNDGYDWQGLDIHSPGIYTQSYLSPEGCPYDSTKEFMQYPESFEGYIDTVICGETLIYEGEEYFNPGNYTLYYEDANEFGCDSFAFLSLDLSYMEVETDFYCDTGTFVLTSEVIVALPNQLGLQYRWYRNGTLVSTEPSFVSTQPGTFTLFLDYFQCEFAAVTNPIVINLDELVPAEPDVAWADTVCANESQAYPIDIDTLDAIRFYEWSINPPEVPFVSQDSLNSEILVDWQGFTGGTICVRGVNHCGEGPDSCFAVTVIPAPTAAFAMATQACAGSDVMISFTGAGTADATYLWNFGGGIVQSGGTGPGPHIISWNTPGTHTVSLQVFEAQCDTSVFTQDIFIENLGTPVINCNTTVNSVTFEWSPVSGAQNYQVNVLQGPAGTIVDDTSYIVSGLAPGTTVEIQVVVTGTGACPPTMATAECIAQNCPPRTLQIQIAQDVFCLDEVMGPVMLTALVDGSPAMGTWSGPGVNPGGTFDPVVAGQGQHTIVFMYSDGTCMYQRSRDVTVFESPTAPFDVDAVICQEDVASVQYTGNASVNATYTWDFDSGNASGNGAGPYTVSWTNPGMYQISLIVEEDGCESEVFTQLVDVQPSLSVPSISCFPTTNSVTIQWGIVPNATDYDITHLFGPMGTVNGNQYQVTGLMPGDSVSIQIEISANSICPPVVIVASCVAQECPMPIIEVDPVDDICLYTGTGSVDLNVTVTNGSGSGSWSGNGITDTQSGIFDPNIAGPGSHLIEYVYNDSGCSFLESITIDVFDPPSALISNMDLTLTCDNSNELVLDGSMSSGQGSLTYSWSTPDGLLTGPTNQSTATAGAEGEYILTVIDQASQCEDMVSVILTTDADLPKADAGPDGLLDCNSSSVDVGGNSETGVSITYAWSSPDGGVIDSDPSGQTITVSTGGTYIITVTDSDNGCTAVDEVVVNTDYTTPASILSVESVIDCDESTTTISAMAMPPGSYTYQWSTVNGQIISGNGTASIIVDRAGVYTLTLTSQANGCSDINSVEVFADPEVIAGLDMVINPPGCPGDADGSLHLVDVINGTPPYAYEWSNQMSGTILQELSPGSYTVTVTDANGCTFMQTYTFPEPIPIDPNIGIDLEYEYGDSVIIILTVQDIDAIASIEWQGPFPSCPGCPELHFLATQSGSVTVTVTDTNGCVASDMLALTVDVNRNVFIPNVFSPNGDNVNDIFTINGKRLERIEDFRIFDRWGDVVYEQKNLIPGSGQGWDGTYKGKEHFPGVFVYQARLFHTDGLNELVTGTVTLLR